MKFVPFVLKHLRRNWIRTASTVLAISACIFLFCTLQMLIKAVSWGFQSANASRLITRHNVSLIFPMPVPYGERIKSIQGVESVAISNWFGGVYKDDRRNWFASFAIDAEPYLTMYPEYTVGAAEKAAFLADRRGALVGRKLLEKNHWKVGDMIQLKSDISPYKKAGNAPFEFQIQGVYNVDETLHPGADVSQFFFHYPYLVESLLPRHPQVGTFVIHLHDPAQAGPVSAAVDAQFENSDTQTHTETESAFIAGFVSMGGNLAYLLNMIGLAVTFTILLVTANTMSMALRERRTEIAVLKTLGFPSRLVLLLVIGEAVAIGILGGLLGVLLGGVAIGALSRVPLIGAILLGLPESGLSPAVAGLGLAMSLLLGLLAGLFPAIGAYRARIADTLRHV